MELFETSEIIAKDVLEKGDRVIKATKGKGLYTVTWINVNNKTFGLSGRKGNELMQNCEDYRFFIQVPQKAKTVF